MVGKWKCSVLLLARQQPLVYGARREMFVRKYGVLMEQKILARDSVFGVVGLKHLCRWVKIHWFGIISFLFSFGDHHHHIF
jgi:hypothetical protein